MDFSRRDWLFGTIGMAAWAEIAVAQEHAHQAVAAGSQAFTFFDPGTAAEVASLAARIVPSDDGPGATEAGAVFFIDRALKTFEADKQPLYKTGLTDLQDRRKKLFPDSTSITGLGPPQQDELIRSIEKSEFFGVLRTHTLLGFLGDPSYSGNRGKAGWKYIDFDDRMTWQPPFGYYDAEAK
jgi:gluconate 2-dehydrogenase gamma chain